MADLPLDRAVSLYWRTERVRQLSKATRTPGPFTNHWERQLESALERERATQQRLEQLEAECETLRRTVASLRAELAVTRGDEP